jgi:hypothetical protein
MIDWAEPLILSRTHIKTAETQLTLAGPLNDELTKRMLLAAELELCEARDKINDCLAVIRARR